MIRDAQVVCLSSIDWSFSRQIPQEAASAFAERGSRVLFIENTGVRHARLSDWPRLWLRLRNWWQARGNAINTSDAVDVFSPLLLPFPYSKTSVAFNTQFLLAAIRRWLNDSGGPVIVLTFLPTPLAHSVTEALKPDLVVYYCLDRFAESSPAARRVISSEEALLAQADLVLVTSHSLQEMAEKIRPRVELLSSGVSIAAFKDARGKASEDHPAFRNLSRPIVGYVGTVRAALDLTLLHQVAKLAPDLQFMLVGPRYVTPVKLIGLPNVHFVDAVPDNEVADYMARFDVGILPYELNSFTASIMPVKLKEYLAAGLPVVATSLPEVCKFAEKHRDVVSFADDPSAFIDAIRAALSDVSPAAAERRIAVACQYDKHAQMARLTDLVNVLLETKTGHRARKSTRSVAIA
jgi:glycosyltransferase involved in cell wall biosynthesis